MNACDRPAFGKLLADVLAFYRQDVSAFTIAVWWEACAPFDFDQVQKAFTAHAVDPERGQFAPKPADLVRVLHGTYGDRALVAWGKAYEGARRAGAYASVAFDDPVIHAVIEDLGGWSAFCRSGVDELPFLQKRFCDAYRVYARRPGFAFAAVLHGEHAQINAQRGHPSAPPLLLGDPAAARDVMASGGGTPRLQITSVVEALPAPSHQSSIGSQVAGPSARGRAIA